MGLDPASGRVVRGDRGIFWLVIHRLSRRLSALGALAHHSITQSSPTYAHCPIYGF